MVRYYVISLTIVSNKDAKFTLKPWNDFNKEMETQLKFSTIFHPRIDGHLERTIPILEDLLRSYVERTTYHWWSSHIIIVTSQLLVRHHLKLFIGGHIDHHFVNWIQGI